LFIPYLKDTLCLSNRTLTEPITKLALRKVVYPAISYIVAPHARLSAISRHIDPNIADSSLQTPPTIQSRRLSSSKSSDNTNMSSQPDHPALLIPGPIEFDDAVLQSMSHFRYVVLYQHRKPRNFPADIFFFPATARVMLAHLSSQYSAKLYQC
jgi:hypothetical protein